MHSVIFIRVVILLALRERTWNEQTDRHFSSTMSEDGCLNTGLVADSLNAQPKTLLCFGSFDTDRTAAPSGNSVSRTDDVL